MFALGLFAQLRFRRFGFADRAVGEQRRHGGQQSSDRMGDLSQFHNGLRREHAAKVLT